MYNLYFLSNILICIVWHGFEKHTFVKLIYTSCKFHSPTPSFYLLNRTCYLFFDFINSYILIFWNCNMHFETKLEFAKIAF